MTEIKSLVLQKATITTTSSKGGNKFKAEKPTLTAYISASKEDLEKAKEFGLTVYTSNDEGQDFLAIKLSANLVKWNEDGTKTNIETSLTSPNFGAAKDEDGKPQMGKINVLLIKNDEGQDFYRVSDIMGFDIEVYERENPFM